MSAQPMLPLDEEKPAKVSARATTKTLLDLLRRHYIKPGAPLPGGVFVPECGTNGGAGGGSRADALYVGFTSTSGRLLVGHELKVSRSDWLRELEKTGKADFWADACHQWWIVAPGPEVVRAEEVPHGWGLMYPSSRTKTRMQVVLKPVTHADRTPAWDAVRSILGRLDSLRAQHDAQVLADAREKARREAEEVRQIQDRADERRSMTREQSQRLDTLARLEELLGGVSVESYVWDDEGREKVGADTLAAALRLVLATKDLGLGRVNRYQVDAIERAGRTLLAGLDEFAKAQAALLDLAGDR